MRRLIRSSMVALAAVASLVMYFRLPERVPVHWNIRGEVDRYASGWEALLLMPLIMLAVWGLLRVLPTIDPLRANYAKFAGTYETMIDVILAMFLGFHIVVLAGAAGGPQNIEVYARAMMGVMFIIFGNIMPRTRQNWFVGVRTPWTLASPRVWEKTHRVGGYLFVAIGVLTLLALPLPPQVAIPILGGCVGAVAIAMVAYSYVEWRKERTQLP